MFVRHRSVFACVVLFSLSSTVAACDDDDNSAAKDATTDIITKNGIVHVTAQVLLP